MTASDVDRLVGVLEGTVGQMNERLGSIDTRLERLEEKVDRQFWWLIGAIVAFGVALTLLVISVGLGG